MKVIRKSGFSGNTNTMELNVTPEQLERWQAGELPGKLEGCELIHRILQVPLLIIGQARNGAYGLFTGNFLAWGFGAERPSDAEAKETAERVGFEYTGSSLPPQE